MFKDLITPEIQRSRGDCRIALINKLLRPKSLYRRFTMHTEPSKQICVTVKLYKLLSYIGFFSSLDATFFPRRHDFTRGLAYFIISVFQL